MARLRRRIRRKRSRAPHGAWPCTPMATAAMARGGTVTRHEPHDAPWSMAIPLIVLAIGSVLAGYVGVPHALGGHNRIEAFLEPELRGDAPRLNARTSASRRRLGAARAMQAAEHGQPASLQMRRTTRSRSSAP